MFSGPHADKTFWNEKAYNLFAYLRRLFQTRKYYSITIFLVITYFSEIRITLRIKLINNVTAISSVHINVKYLLHCRNEAEYNSMIILFSSNKSVKCSNEFVTYFVRKQM